MKRLFAAIKISPSEDFLKFYYSIRNMLREDRIKWVAPENMHLTLKFFGETEEDKIPQIQDALQIASQKSSAFNIEIKNTGIFGSTYKPRAIWFGIDTGTELNNLAENIFEELQKLGWERDRQNFVPHLTIGRVKFLQDKSYFQQVIDSHKEKNIQLVDVHEFHLYESVLRREGPVYTKVAGFELGL